MRLISLTVENFRSIKSVKKIRIEPLQSFVGENNSGNLQKTHPNYLVLEQDYDLFLNIIDPPVPLFMPQLFTSFLSFATKHWGEGKRLLIHCNQGESRAPSLALLFLSKSLSVINKTSYQSARKDFEIIYPQYKPGQGIEIYFIKNWDTIGYE